MAHSRVQTIATEEAVLSSRQWVIGAAPNEAPYWPLQDEDGRQVARVLLLFKDRSHADRSMRQHFMRWNPDIIGTVQRALWDVTATSAATSRCVKNITGDLRAWASSVLQWCEMSPMPGDLDQHADLVMLPRVGWYQGQIAVVHEDAISDGRVVVRPRDDLLRWQQ